MASSSSSFHYSGEDGEEVVPHDVEELIIDPLLQIIPEDAFGWRRSLLQVVNLSCQTIIIKSIGDRAFYECTSLQHMEIPPTVQRIGDSAFYNCASLETVYFLHHSSPSAEAVSTSTTALVTIDECAFKLCVSLKQIDIPASVETIGVDAFLQCASLTRVSFFQEEKGGRLQVIGIGAFAGCADLSGTVEIPGTVRSLGESVFEGCDSLQVVDLKEGGNLTALGEMAFMGCHKLESISVPSTIERIMLHAFQTCKNLKLVQLQNGLQYLEEYAFCNCEGLSSISIPPSVVAIVNCAFYGCTNLVSVEIGCRIAAAAAEGMKIQHAAFGRCSSLVNLSLTDVSSVDHTAFGGCTMLEDTFGADLDLPTRLKQRFDGFPIHKLCYYASTTTVDELSTQIEQGRVGDYSRHGLVDVFGMTPVHVLLSAARRRADLLKLLLDEYPPHILGWKDSCGKLAIEFLHESYWNADSKRVMRMTLERWMVDSISHWGGLEVWKSHLLEMVNEIVAEDDQGERESFLASAIQTLSRYEQIEATSCLELAVWKKEMAQNVPAAENAGREGMIEQDRDFCRIRSGVTIILPNVVEFIVI